MALEIEQPDDLQSAGGNFVNQPGHYHMVVTEVDENPIKQDGTPLNGLKLSLSCLASTAAGQVEKTHELMLWNPSHTDTDDQRKKTNQKLTRFCLAVGLLGQHSPGQKATVEPSLARGRQLVIELAWKRKFDEQTRKWVDTDHMDLKQANIWHIDDPEVSKNNWPLDQSMIADLPLELRKIPAPPVDPAAAGNAAAVAATTTATQAAPAAAAGGLDAV